MIDFKKTDKVGKAECFDCKLPYEDFSCDMLIQNFLWDKISPSTNHGCGLLCPDCICKRLMKLGLTCVRVVVDTSELIDIDSIR